MKQIYAIRDRLAKDLVGMQMYLLLVFRTDQQAARYFADAVNDKTSMLNKHPADYELVRVGSIDEQGNIVPSDPFMNIIITGDALVAVQEPALVKES